MKKSLVVLLVLVISLSGIFAASYGFNVVAGCTFDDSKPYITLGLRPYIQTDDAKLQFKLDWSNGEHGHFVQFNKYDNSTPIDGFSSLMQFINVAEIQKGFLYAGLSRDVDYDFQHASLALTDCRNLSFVLKSDYGRMENRIFVEKLSGISDEAFTELTGIQLKYNFTEELNLNVSALTIFDINIKDNDHASEFIPQLSMDIPLEIEDKDVKLNWAFVTSSRTDVNSKKIVRHLLETWGAELGYTEYKENLTTKFVAFVGKGIYYHSSIVSTSDSKNHLTEGSYVGFEASAVYTKGNFTAYASLAMPIDSANGWKVLKSGEYTADKLELGFTAGDNYTISCSVYSDGIVGKFQKNSTAEGLLSNTQFAAELGIDFERVKATVGVEHVYGTKAFDVVIGASMNAENFFRNN